MVIASGPSLRRDDLEALRGVGKAVAVNCAVFWAPWADVLYAGDAIWWRFYGPKVEWFKGQRVSRSYQAKNIVRWRGEWPRTGGNSGHLAIQYAADHGSKRIALIGFDQQKTDGKAHFHGDHPRRMHNKPTNLGNANGAPSWPRLMAKSAQDFAAREIEVVNLSRKTALACFPQMTVEEFLEKYDG